MLSTFLFVYIYVFAVFIVWGLFDCIFGYHLDFRQKHFRDVLKTAIIWPLLVWTRSGWERILRNIT